MQWLCHSSYWWSEFPILAFKQSPCPPLIRYGLTFDPFKQYLKYDAALIWTLCLLLPISQERKLLYNLHVKLLFIYIFLFLCTLLCTVLAHLILKMEWSLFTFMSAYKSLMVPWFLYPLWSSHHSFFILLKISLYKNPLETNLFFRHFSIRQ